MRNLSLLSTHRPQNTRYVSSKLWFPCEVANKCNARLLQVLPGRLAKSKALQDMNQLKLQLKDTQEELAAIQGKKGMDEEREVRFYGPSDSR